MKSLLVFLFVASLALSNGQAPLNITANHDTEVVNAVLNLNQTYAGLELEGSKNFTVIADVDGTTVFGLEKISLVDGLVYSDATGYGAEGEFGVALEQKTGTDETATYESGVGFGTGTFPKESYYVAFNKTHGRAEGVFEQGQVTDLEIRDGEDLDIYQKSGKSVDSEFEVAPGETTSQADGEGGGDRGFKVGDMLDATDRGDYEYQDGYKFDDDTAEIFTAQRGGETKNLRIGDGNGPVYIDATYTAVTQNSIIDIRDLDLLRSFVLATEAPLLKFILTQLIDQRRAIGIAPVVV